MANATVVDDNIINPNYYRMQGLYFQSIDLNEQFSCDVGNMLKYVFRLHSKDEALINAGKALWYAKRAVLHGEQFKPVLPTAHHDAADMLDTLSNIDWQGAGEFWALMAGVVRDENTVSELMESLERMDVTLRESETTHE